MEEKRSEEKVWAVSNYFSNLAESDMGYFVAGEVKEIFSCLGSIEEGPEENQAGAKSNLISKKVKKLCESNKRPLKHGFYALFRAGKVDLRTRLGKTIRYLRSELINHCGGNPSVPERILIDRIIQKAIKCHLYEMGLLKNPNQSGKDHYLALANSLRHDLQALGIKKRVKDMTDLRDYLERKQRSNGHHPSGL